jgi:predicted Rossmann-fold nucleotide-binding protein
MTDLETLSRHGDLYPEERHLQPVPDMLYTSSSGLLKSVRIDEEVLGRSGMVYTEAPQLARYLTDHSVEVADYAAAYSSIQAAFERQGQVWGFSGYATGGFAYAAEAHGMSEVYARLAARNRLPAMAIDGGVSAGVLGLSALIARNHHVRTMGVIPYAGLGSVGVRDDMLVWGHTYKQREEMVGSLPDVLVCVGGAEGTRRECQQAITCGSAVLLLASKDYGEHALPATYKAHEDLALAEGQGRLIVCGPDDDIAASVDRIYEAGQAGDRARRLPFVGRLLGQ